MLRHLHTGNHKRTRLFVLTLGCSRKSVRLLVFLSSWQAWAELHEKLFRWLGGATRVVVPYSLREGVFSPRYRHLKRIASICRVPATVGC